MNPDTLVSQTINRLVSSYSDDILNELIDKATVKLKGQTFYKIVTGIHGFSIIIDHDKPYTINQYLEEEEIVIKCLIKLIENFDIFDYETWPDTRWSKLKTVIASYNYSIFDRNEILSLTSYAEYLKYFLQKIEKYKQFDDRLYLLRNLWNQIDHSINGQLIRIYEETVADKAMTGFKYGFTLSESLKLYEILNEFISENNIPNYLDIELIFHYVLVQLYDYVICYFDDDRGLFNAIIVRDKLNIKLKTNEMNLDFDVKIYQVTF